MSIPYASVICKGSLELTYHPSEVFSSLKIRFAYDVRSLSPFCLEKQRGSAQQITRELQIDSLHAAPRFVFLLEGDYLVDRIIVFRVIN
jgi:hypothetical protein